MNIGHSQIGFKLNLCGKIKFAKSESECEC